MSFTAQAFIWWAALTAATTLATLGLAHARRSAR